MRIYVIKMNARVIAPVFGMLLGVFYSAMFSGCGGANLMTHDIPRFGIGGRYTEGREQFTRGRGGDMDKAVSALEAVVAENPLYKDSLMLLGRAYYRKARYKDAYQMLQRAVVVNKEDEIAWVALGMTQLQLGDDTRGIETLKGGITLISKVAVLGYRNYPEWDIKGTVRAAIRRSAFEITKGPEAKPDILRSCETLLARMDDEENYQKNVAPAQYRQGL
jgi:tetratricopeptide (TPR) repeat protein